MNTNIKVTFSRDDTQSRLLRGAGGVFPVTAELARKSSLHFYRAKNGRKEIVGILTESYEITMK